MFRGTVPEEFIARMSACGWTTTIVASNHALNSADDILGSFHANSSHNLIGTDAALLNGIDNNEDGNKVGGESSALEISASLTPLAYRGRNQVRVHALRNDSDAIDMGNNSVAVALGLDEGFDQRGDPYIRIVDWGDDDLNDVIDIGAGELAMEEIFPYADRDRSSCPHRGIAVPTHSLATVPLTAAL